MPRLASIHWCAVLFCALSMVSHDTFAANTFTSVQSGDWDNPFTWGTQLIAPPNNLPVAGDTVNIGTGANNSHTVTVTSPSAAAATIVIGNTNGFCELRVFGSLTVSGNITANSNTFINVNGGGALSVAGTLTLNNFSNLQATGFMPTNLGGLSGSGEASGNLSIAGGTFNGRVQGQIEIKTGTFTLVPSTNFGPASSGTFTITSGALKLTSGSTSFQGLLDDYNSNINIVGGTFDLNGASETVQSIQGAGSISLGNATLTVTNGSPMPYSGVISGSGGFAMQGGGTVTLTGANTYTGATTVYSGSLAVGSSSINALSAVRLFGGSLMAATSGPPPSPFEPGDTLTIGSLEGNGFINLPGSLNVGGNNTSTFFSGTIDLFSPDPMIPSIFQKSGTGTLTLGGQLDFEPGDPETYEVKVTAGTLKLDFDNVIDNEATLNISSGATFNMNGRQEEIGGLKGSGTLLFGDNFGQFLTVNQAFNTTSTFSGLLTTNGFFPPGFLPGNLTKQGLGTLTLSGTANCNIDIQDGPLKLGASQVINDYANVNVQSNFSAAFELSNNSETIQSLMGNGSVKLGTGTLSIGPPQNVFASNTTFNGVIEGTGGITKTGDNVLSLGGENTYTGATNVNGGTLEISNFGKLSTSTALTVSLNAVFRTNSMVEVGSLAGSGFVEGYLKSGGNNSSTTFSGFQNGGDFVKAGTGVLTISGFIFGRVDIEKGTVRLGQTFVIDDFRPVRVAQDAIFDLNGNKETICALEGAGSVTLGTATLSIGSSGLTFDNPPIFSGVIGGTGGVTVLFGGTLELAGSNTYTGTTLVEGTLKLGDAEVIPNASAVVMQGGTISVSNPTLPPDDPNDETIGSLSGFGSVTVDGKLTTGGNDTSTTYGGSFNGNLTKRGTGTMTLEGPVTNNNGNELLSISIIAGTLRLGNNNVIDDNSTIAISAGASLDLNNQNETINSVTGAGSVNFGSIGGNTLNVGSDGQDSTFAGSLFSSAAFPGASTLVKSGAGELTLSGSANTTIQITGGKVRLGSAGVINDQVGVIIDGGATFDLDDKNEAVLYVSGSGNVTLGDATLSVGPSQGGFDVDRSFAGSISNGASGTGGLTKTGSNLFDLNGVNDYVGPTTVNGGALFVSNALGLSDATAVIVSTGSTFISNQSLEVGSISGAGNVLVAAALTAGGDNSSTVFNGTFNGPLAGGFVKSGTGTLTLSGVFDSGITVNSGTVKLGADNVVSDAAAIVVNTNTPTIPKFDLNNNNETIGSLAGQGNVTLGSGTLTILDNADGQTPNYSGVMSGTGDMVLMRALILSGANTYTGSTVVQVGGTLTLGAAGVIRDTSPVTVEVGGSLVSTNATFNETVGSLQGSGVLDYAGTFTFGGLNTSTTYTGDITAGGLTKTGLGNFSCFGALDTPSISIAGGTITLEVPDLINDSAGVAIAAGARLDLNNNNETFAALSGAGLLLFGNSIPNTLTVGSTSSQSFTGTISGVDTSDSLIKVGTGTLTLSGTNSYVGTTTVSAGTLTVLGAFPSTVTVENGATLAGTSTIGAVTDNGFVDPGTGAGTGTITVSGNANLTTGALSVDIPSDSSGDRLTVNGNLTLDGTSSLLLDLSGFTNVMPNSVFTVASAGGTLSGVFTTETITNNSSGKPVFVSYHVPGQIRVAVGNNAPVIDLNGGGGSVNHSTTYTEGAAPRPIVVVDNLTVTDSETGTVDSVDITITNLLNPGSEILAATPAGNISVDYNPATGVLSLTGVDTVARYQTVLRTVTYQNTSADPDDSAVRTITFVARDERDTSIISAPSTCSVTIIPANTPPFVDLNGSDSGANFSSIFTEDGGPVTIVSNTGLISDPDSDAINSATLTITNLLDAGLETLAVTTNGNIVASFNPQTGVLSLSGADTLSEYEAVLRSVTYENTSQNPSGASRTITVSVKEGVAPSNEAVAQVAIRSVNDVPSFTKGADQSVVEDAGPQTVAGWATAISSGPTEESAQILTFNLTSNNPALFAVAPQVNAAGDLTYTPAEDVNGTAVVTVTLSDSGGTNFGGVDTAAPQTFVITVTAIAENFIVTNVNDDGPGSLRDRMERARSGDTITFDENVFDLTNADAATIINVSEELPALDDGNVTIDAQDRRVTINGSGAGSASGLVITSSNNLVRGLSIVGFTKSGVFITAAATSNLIGGNRNQGAGPNGQGLRVGNCGAFAIEISGVGTSLNIVRGCWLGLDASGVSAQPNLAGILIQGGATANTIGGTVDGEANVLSGNTFEGVTISGAGTDDNIIIGNIVGSSAVETASASRGKAASRNLIIGRVSVGNGTAGVFLSKGTKGSQVGGENSGDGNGIANNGGNGIEVRAQLTRRNSARANGISKNRRGGIALFDGSNDGITPPVFTSVVAAPRVTGAASRSDLSAVIIGRANINSGKVEVFADPESQGSRLVGRAIVVNGEWQVAGDVTDTENITATFTDDNGNTSAFAFFGRAPAQGSGGIIDTDGDGVSDALEILAQTDPLNGADAPVQQGAVTALKFSAGLNFAVTGKDSIKSSLQIALPTGFTVASSSAAVQFDAVSRSVVLNEKGKSPTGNVAMKLTTKKGATTSVLTVSMKSQDLRAGLTPSGLTDKTTAKTGEALSVPIAVVLTSGTSKHAYVGTVNVTYKATQTKRGRAGKTP